jgi:hypothetical protein
MIEFHALIKLLIFICTIALCSSYVLLNLNAEYRHMESSCTIKTGCRATEAAQAAQQPEGWTERVQDKSGWIRNAQRDLYVEFA